MGESREISERVSFGINEEGASIDGFVRRYVEILRDRFHVRSVIVMGSRATGRWKPWSDTDVLVVADDLPKKSLRWSALKDLDDELVGGLIEPRGYTSKELIDAIERFDLTVMDAIEDGIPVYDDGFWRKARERFEAVRRAFKLRRTDVGWEYSIPRHGSLKH